GAAATAVNPGCRRAAPRWPAGLRHLQLAERRERRTGGPLRHRQWFKRAGAALTGRPAARQRLYVCGAAAQAGVTRLSALVYSGSGSYKNTAVLAQGGVFGSRIKADQMQKDFSGGKPLNSIALYVVV